MKVEIKPNKDTVTTFDKLESGACFYLTTDELFSESIRMKIKDGSAINAISLCDGEHICMSSLANVVFLPNAKVVIK